MTSPPVTEAAERTASATAPKGPDAPPAGPTFAGFTGWTELGLLAGAFALVILVSALLAWRVGPAPDEDSHLFMAVHQSHSLSQPAWQEMQWGGNRAHSYNLYSPLPYYAYAPFVRLQEAVGWQDGAGRPDRFVIRMGGVLVFGSAQLALTIWMVRRMRRTSSNDVVILVALAANLMPQLRYTHAYVNTDSFTILAATACFALVLRMWQRRRVGLADAVLVGGALTAVAHGRYNGYVAAGVLAVAFAVFVIRRATDARVRLRLIGLAIAIPLLLAAPVHLAIVQELRNDHILASTDHDELARSTHFGGLADDSTLGAQLDAWASDTGAAWGSTWASYLRFFELQPAWAWTLAALSVVGLVGLVLRSPELLTSAGRGVGLLAAGATLLTWVLMISWPYHLGRFLLPAAATAVVGIILGGGVVIERLGWLGRLPGLLISGATWLTVLGVLDVVAYWSLPLT